MEPYFGVAWKKFDIFDAIKLLIIESSMDQELLMVAISFWCSATNTMVLHLGPIGATVLDVTASIGTSPNDIPISIALSGYQFDLDLKMVFEECVYEILKKKGDKVLKDEVSKLHKKNSSITARLSTTSLVKAKMPSGKGNTRPSCFISRTSLSFIPNQTSALSRICWLPKPWLVVTNWHLVPPFSPTLTGALPRPQSRRLIHIRMAHFGSSNFGFRLTLQP
ncbi:hypothetical protein ACFX1R_049264 [Malus domestica]